MSRAGLRRLRRQQLLREAEGYLELLELFEDRWPLGRERRQCLAQQALDVLAGVGRRHEDMARVHLLRGRALQILERYSEAVEPLEAAAELVPDATGIYLLLGWCYKRCGRLDLAIRSLERARQVEPDEPVVYYNLACYWSLAGDVRRVVPLLAKAFVLDAKYRDLVADEPDFDPVRDHPDFQALMTVEV